MSLYVVLEGLDGTGKSVQADRLCKWLVAEGKEPLHLREPGSTPVGEVLRRILLDPDTGSLSPLTEALLFCAARAQLLDDQIRPALAAGRPVVAERCFVSTLVYQGMAPSEHERVPLDLLETLTGHMHEDLWPDAIFLLDLDPEECARRSGRDRIERRDEDYRHRAREGFLVLAQRVPGMEVIDGSPPVEVVQESLRKLVSRMVS